MVTLIVASSLPAAELLVEAEGFAEQGGWVVDCQFMDQMGSPYLLAHGLGKPVAHAKTIVEFPELGSYRVWVRTMDWVPSHHPGRFRVLLDGTLLAPTLGTTGEGWVWQDAGTVDVKRPKVTIELRDLTGFDGRCDALYFTTNRDSVPPAKPGNAMSKWRRELLGLPEKPPAAGAARAAGETARGGNVRPGRCRGRSCGQRGCADGVPARAARRIDPGPARAWRQLQPRDRHSTPRPRRADRR